MNNELRDLYMTNSKHSNYQAIPNRLKKIIKENEFEINSRYETERLKYIIDNIEIRDKKVLDIGGNTGFFTFESLDAGAKCVDYYEGNTVHANFVKKAVGLTNLEDKVTVFSEYYLFEQEKRDYDIAFLLNVIHHLGDDFGNEDDIQTAKETMLKNINQMASVTKYLVFQMGFNWCGDRTKCLFSNGTKEEMIDFLRNGIEQNWEIIKIGVAVGTKKKICYEDVDDINIQRNDTLGEFLNRPIFIMKSKQ